MVNAHRWGEVLAELGHDLGHHDDDPAAAGTAHVPEAAADDWCAT